MQRAGIRTNAWREEDVFSTTDALAVAEASTWLLVANTINARDSRYALHLETLAAVGTQSNSAMVDHVNIGTTSKSDANAAVVSAIVFWETRPPP